jgi:hypothetical protein
MMKHKIGKIDRQLPNTTPRKQVRYMNNKIHVKLYVSKLAPTREELIKGYAKMCSDKRNQDYRGHNALCIVLLNKISQTI